MLIISVIEMLFPVVRRMMAEGSEFSWTRRLVMWLLFVACWIAARWLIRRVGRYRRGQAAGPEPPADALQ